METKDNSRDKSLGQVQRENSAQQHGPDQDSPAEMVLDHQRTPSRALHALRRALLDSKAENKELAAENAALREQIASKELSWEQEKKKLLDEKDSLVSTLFMARNDMESLVKALESARARQKQFDTQRKAMERKMKEKEVEFRSLQASLRFQMMETEKLEKSWKAERDQVNEMKLSFDKTVTQINAEWESQWIVRQEEVAAELKTLQQDCEKKASQVIQEKDDVITSVRKEMMALVEENVSKLTTIKTEIHQSETKWQTKHKALEDRLRCELAAKEESFKKTEELQKQSREMEEKWLAKEEEWLNKASKMEEEMKLLSQQNVELQELASKTDKEKAKMKKEEKKAKKETEKRMKKERKEKEEREKKEKEENEKKEKERLKREKKENQEREKKEKKETEKREKREKKKKEETEKREE